MSSARKAADEATAFTAEVMADPNRSFAEGMAAAWEEQQAYEAWRNQPVHEGARTDLELEAGT